MPIWVRIPKVPATLATACLVVLSLSTIRTARALSTAKAWQSNSSLLHRRIDRSMLLKFTLNSSNSCKANKWVIHTVKTTITLTFHINKRMQMICRIITTAHSSSISNINLASDQQTLSSKETLLIALSKCQEHQHYTGRLTVHRIIHMSMWVIWGTILMEKYSHKTFKTLITSRIVLLLNRISHTSITCHWTTQLYRWIDSRQMLQSSEDSLQTLTILTCQGLKISKHSRAAVVFRAFLKLNTTIESIILMAEALLLSHSCHSGRSNKSVL